MMNINEMTTQEKSEKLYSLVGWKKEWADFNSMILLDSNGKGVGHGLMKPSVPMPNLYDEKNMALAWRVLNWAEAYSQLHATGDFYDGWMQLLPECLFLLAPTDAQTAWLDKILELAIEAGMIE